MYLNHNQRFLLSSIMDFPDNRWHGEDRKELNYLSSLGLCECTGSLRYEITEEGIRAIVKKKDPDIAFDKAY